MQDPFLLKSKIDRQKIRLEKLKELKREMVKKVEKSEKGNADKLISGI